MTTTQASSAGPFPAAELAVADGEHEAAYARYDEIMRRYARIAGKSNAGRVMAPKTAWGNPLTTLSRDLRRWFEE